MLLIYFQRKTTFLKLDYCFFMFLNKGNYFLFFKSTNNETSYHI